MSRACELCGADIPKERLDALPTTKRCVACSERNGSDVAAKRIDVSMDKETYKDLLGATRT